MSFDLTAAAIKQRARELGFDLVGIAPAKPSEHRQYLRQWLDEGNAGEMGYLSGRFEERTNPAAYLPDAASVICVGLDYFVPLEQPREGQGRVARYALGTDYHEVIKTRFPAARGLDSGKLPPRRTRDALWICAGNGKRIVGPRGNRMGGEEHVHHQRKIGSWILLGEVLTTLKLPTDDPAVDRCGSCRKCIEACPTQAITEPYQLEARRCISYLTIEHRGEIDGELAAKFGDWIYGCDICQDVCPWNRDPPAAGDPELRPRWADGSLDPERVLGWTDEDYRRELKGSAMKRREAADAQAERGDCVGMPKK